MCDAAVPNPILRNVALGQAVTQISIHSDKYGAHAPSLAIDGSRQSHYEVFMNGCAGSDQETNPWWAVDLGVSTVVCLVKLTNRDRDDFCMLNSLTFHCWLRYVTCKNRP